jgi:hypothetical protein
VPRYGFTVRWWLNIEARAQRDIHDESPVSIPSCSSREAAGGDGTSWRGRPRLQILGLSLRTGDRSVRTPRGALRIRITPAISYTHMGASSPGTSISSSVGRIGTAGGVAAIALRHRSASRSQSVGFASGISRNRVMVK